MKKTKLGLIGCGKITMIVILMSLLMPFPMFGEPLTERQPTLSENETKRYSDLEVDLLIEDLTEVALDAIKQVAGHAAKAAVLSMADREAALLEAQESLQKDVEKWKEKAVLAKRDRYKNMVITGLACFLGGLFIGGVVLAN